MTPKKRICFTDVSCSLARCAGTNCLWTECIATRPEMDSNVHVRRKSKQGPQAVAVLSSQISHRILGFGATPQTKQEESRKPGSWEGKTGRPGEAKAPGGRTAGYHSTAVVPTFVLWYELHSFVDSSILLRTRHVLLGHCSSTITVLLTTVLLLLLCSRSSSLPLFFSVILRNSLCIFLQVEPFFSNL